MLNVSLLSLVHRRFLEQAGHIWKMLGQFGMKIMYDYYALNPIYGSVCPPPPPPPHGMVPPPPVVWWGCGGTVPLPPCGMVRVWYVPLVLFLSQYLPGT